MRICCFSLFPPFHFLPSSLSFGPAILAANHITTTPPQTSTTILRLCSTLVFTDIDAVSDCNP